jgi:hypothetical protein
VEELERKKWEAVNAKLIQLKGLIENASELLWDIWKIVDEQLDGRNHKES